jgi:hypothetical protein
VTNSEFWFFGDSASPRNCLTENTECSALLRKFGVESKTPELRSSDLRCTQFSFFILIKNRNLTAMSKFTNWVNFLHLRFYLDYKKIFLVIVEISQTSRKLDVTDGQNLPPLKPR